VFRRHDACAPGACGSVLNLFEQEKLNHHTELVGGVLADEAGAMLRAFFAERRLAARSLAASGQPAS
jgi:tRNA(adenine34) deaminase